MVWPRRATLLARFEHAKNAAISAWGLTKHTIHATRRVETHTHDRHSHTHIHTHIHTLYSITHKLPKEALSAIENICLSILSALSVVLYPVRINFKKRLWLNRPGCINFRHTELYLRHFTSIFGVGKRGYTLVMVFNRAQFLFLLYLVILCSHKNITYIFVVNYIYYVHISTRYKVVSLQFDNRIHNTVMFLFVYIMYTHRS